MYIEAGYVELTSQREFPPITFIHGYVTGANIVSRQLDLGLVQSTHTQVDPIIRTAVRLK